MEVSLRFETMPLTGGEPGGESTVPPLEAQPILQNGLRFALGEDEELFEGYGTRENSWPYRAQDTYNRTLSLHTVKTAVLENDFLKAVFLPEYGGRLWQLTDKAAGRELLYTNSVLRFSNLAVCDAWFAGGVEWNMGLIGHSPFTCRSLFCAEYTAPEGWPVLRMYEYERVRGAAYQMDFWLRPDSRALCCRMRITNESNAVLPMYWWSNMAVPEAPGGRVAVPAKAAYHYCSLPDGSAEIRRETLPMVDGADVFRYNTIPTQTDYFFDLDEGAPRFIAGVDGEGVGVLQLSTARLKSRKLFTWGQTIGSARWQAFLSGGMGRYVEIQSGLAKTQYGCLPMPPHTSWEWMEQYGAVRLTPGTSDAAMQAEAAEIARAQLESEALEQMLHDTRPMAKTRVKCVQRGSEYSAFCADLHLKKRDRPLAAHLDFGVCTGALARWETFLHTGRLHTPAPETPPDAFFCEEAVLQKLRETADTLNADNWYAQYQLGIILLENGEIEAARAALEKSAALCPTAWTCHAMANLLLRTGAREQAAQEMEKGLAFGLGGLSYAKAAFRLLLSAEAYETVLRCFEALPFALAADSRLRLAKVKALHALGRYEEAFALLNEGSGLVPEDMREGEDGLERLWTEEHEKIYGEPGEVPAVFRFRAI